MLSRQHYQHHHQLQPDSTLSPSTICSSCQNRIATGSCVSCHQVLCSQTCTSSSSSFPPCFPPTFDNKCSSCETGPATLVCGTCRIVHLCNRCAFRTKTPQNTVTNQRMSPVFPYHHQSPFSTTTSPTPFPKHILPQSFFVPSNLIPENRFDRSVFPVDSRAIAPTVNPKKLINPFHTIPNITLPLRDERVSLISKIQAWKDDLYDAFNNNIETITRIDNVYQRVRPQIKKLQSDHNLTTMARVIAFATNKFAIQPSNDLNELLSFYSLFPSPRIYEVYEDIKTMEEIEERRVAHKLKSNNKPICGLPNYTNFITHNNTTIEPHLVTPAIVMTSETTNNNHVKLVGQKRGRKAKPKKEKPEKRQKNTMPRRQQKKQESEDESSEDDDDEAEYVEEDVNGQDIDIEHLQNADDVIQDLDVQESKEDEKPEPPTPPPKSTCLQDGVLQFPFHSDQLKTICRRFKCRSIQGTDKMILIMDCMTSNVPLSNKGRVMQKSTFSYIKRYVDDASSFRNSTDLGDQLHLNVVENFSMIFQNDPFSQMILSSKSCPKINDSNSTNEKKLSQEQLDTIHQHYHNQDPLVQEILNCKEKQSNRTIQIPYILIPVMYSLLDRGNEQHTVTCLVDFQHLRITIVDPMIRSPYASDVNHPNMRLRNELSIIISMCPLLEWQLSKNCYYMGVQENSDGEHCGHYHLWFTDLLCSLDFTETHSLKFRMRQNRYEKHESCQILDQITSELNGLRTQDKNLVEEAEHRIKSCKTEQSKSQKINLVKYKYHHQIHPIFRFDIEHIQSLFPISEPATIGRKSRFRVQTLEEEDRDYCCSLIRNEYLDMFQGMSSTSEWLNNRFTFQENCLNLMVPYLLRIGGDVSIYSDEIQAEIVDFINEQLFVCVSSLSLTDDVLDERMKEHDPNWTRIDDQLTISETKQLPALKDIIFPTSLNNKREEYKRILLSQIQTV